MFSLPDIIMEILNEHVSNVLTVTRYRKPLIGFASANDPLFTLMKEIIGPHHLLSTDLLPNAHTVVAFFLPFTEDLIKAHRNNSKIPREWSVAYIETNALIATISQELKKELASFGISAVTQKATHNFNEQNLTAVWSHKSAAYVAGLGTFGLNQMLITPSGCAGRFGSLIISAEIPPTPRPTVEYCSYKRDGKCQFCVNNCPTGALTLEGLNKQKCYERLLKIDQEFPDLGLCDVCGKCAIGPCALKALPL